MNLIWWWLSANLLKWYLSFPKARYNWHTHSLNVFKNDFFFCISQVASYLPGRCCYAWFLCWYNSTAPDMKVHFVDRSTQRDMGAGVCHMTSGMVVIPCVNREIGTHVRMALWMWIWRLLKSRNPILHISFITITECELYTLTSMHKDNQCNILNIMEYILIELLKNGQTFYGQRWLLISYKVN